MFPESFLEYSTVVDSTLRDWAGYQLDDLHLEQQ